MPAASHIEKEGTFTNTAAAAAVARQGARPAGRRPLRAVVHAPPGQARASAHYAGSERPARLADPATSRGTTPSTASTPSRRAEAVLREINGYDVATGEPVAGFAELEDDGSTACGCWIYSGVYADGVNQARRREPGDLDAPGGWVSPEWGWAWPANRRILYNRASADPDGKPWSERKKLRLVGRGARASGPATTCPTSRSTSAPDYRGADDAQRHGRDRRRRPVHHDGRRPRAGCSRRPACSTGRCRRTTSRSSRRCANPLYPRARREPGGAALDPAGEPVRRARRPALPARGDDVPADRAPHGRRRCRATCRGWPSCSRRCSPRSTRCSPRERGIEDGGWMTIVTARAEIEARAMVTDADEAAADRRPARAPGRPAVALGLRGAASPATPRTTSARCPATRTSSIQESKAFIVQRARGPAQPRGDRGRWPASATRRRASPSTTTTPPRSRPARSDRDRRPPRPDAAAHGLLHRHHDVHRLQGVRGGVQAVERPARRRRGVPRGGSYDHTGELDASTWRHVRFVELDRPTTATSTSSRQLEE